MFPQTSPNQRVFQLELPLKEKTNKSGDADSLNLNVFRNLHFYKLSYQKKSFHKRMSKPLSQLPKLGKVWLHYEIHPRDKRRLDTMNPGSVLDKFFSDALVEAGVIEDDDYTNVVFNSFCFGSVNKDNPHALVTIREIEPREEDKQMRILLDEEDIQTALENYVETLGIPNASGVDVTVNDDGEIEAEVLTGGAKPAAKAPPKPRVKNKGGRPPGSKNKPKPSPNETEDDDGSDASDEDRTDSDDSGDADGPEEQTPEPSSDDDKPAAKSEGRKSKNLFEDSPEESSKADQQTTEEGGAEAETPPVKKKPSIFDAD
jgi:hypothetical protein